MDAVLQALRLTEIMNEKLLLIIDTNDVDTSQGGGFFPLLFI